VGEAQERVCLLQLCGGDGLRREALRGGKEECRRSSADRVERGEVPDLGSPAEHQRRSRELHEPVDRVRRDHHAVPREAVGDHAAEEEEEDLRHESGRDDEPEVGRGAGDVEDGERERDRCDRASCLGCEAAGEEKAELALAERRERVSHAGAVSDRLRQ